ncbi:hypothetical protein Emag_005415 [Eimeria magna]
MRPLSLKASCILVGLCMHGPSWPPLCLLAGGTAIESGNESFGSGNSRPESLGENLGSLTVSAEQTWGGVENADLHVLPSNSDVTDEIGAQLEDGTTQGNIEVAGKYPRNLAFEQKPFHPSLSSTGFRVSMVVAVCLCFLALPRKGPPTPQAGEQSRIQQTGEVDEKLSSRYKALQALVPVADQLAKTVDTAEARELLEAVHANVLEAGEADGEGSTMNEASIEKALSAMRALQQAAIKEAGSILWEKFDNLSSVSLSLEDWEDRYFSEEETEGLSPFITALTLSQNQFLEVSQHMREVYQELEQAQPFEDEQDVNSLLSTTNAFRFVLKLHQEKEVAAALASEQLKMAEAAMRMALSRKTSQGFRQLWGKFEIAQAHLNMAMKAGGAAAEEGESAAEVQGHLDEAELRLAKYKAELKRLMNYSRSDSHDSISSALTRNITLEQEQESLSASLAKHWDLFKKHLKTPRKLDDSVRESVKLVLRRALQRISQDRDTMDAAIISTFSRMTRVFGASELNDQRALFQIGMHDVLRRRMTEDTLNLLNRGEGRIAQLEYLLQLVDQEEDTNAVEKMMESAVASAVQSSDELTGLLLSLLRINLLISLERDANSTMMEATDFFQELKGFSSQSSLGPAQLECLLDAVGEQENLLAQACWAARNAGALEDRIKAAGRIQESSFLLRHSAYSLKYNIFPKRRCNPATVSRDARIDYEA